MSVKDRTIEQVSKQHVGVLEQALEKLTLRWPPSEFVRVEHSPSTGAPGSLWRSALHHVPSGFDLYAVETTMDDVGIHTRGWVPEGGRLLDHGQEPEVTP